MIFVSRIPFDNAGKSQNQNIFTITDAVYVLCDDSIWFSAQYMITDDYENLSEAIYGNLENHNKIDFPNPRIWFCIEKGL